VAIKQIEKKLIREDQMPQIMVTTHSTAVSGNNNYFNYVGLDTCEISFIYLYSIYLFSYLIIC